MLPDSHLEREPVFWRDADFRAELWWRVSRTDRMTEAFPRVTAEFLSSYKLPKKLPVTTLLLFRPVTFLLWDISLFIWWVKDPFSCQTVNTIRPTHPWSMLLPFPFTQMSGASEPQRNCPPYLNFHTDGDAENRRMIPALNRPCGWG